MSLTKSLHGLLISLFILVCVLGFASRASAQCPPRGVGAILGKAIEHRLRPLPTMRGPVQTAAPNSEGCFQSFAGDASVFWTPCDGAWMVRGPIRQLWSDLGREAGHLGFPISDETTDGTGTRISRFQYGTIKWNRIRGAWADNELELKVLSYNVQFRTPELIVGLVSPGWPNTRERAEAIGRAVRRYDVIALNEVFRRDRMRQLAREAETAAGRCGKPSRIPSGSAFTTALGPEPERTVAGQDVVQILLDGGRFLVGEEEHANAVINSGLVVLTRFPILSTAQHTYAAKSGEDALARKGVLYLRLWRGGPTSLDDILHVFVTHMQNADSAVRDRQIAELADFIRSRTADARNRPVIVMGDLNINGNADQQRDPTSQYSLLLSSLRRASPLIVDLWPQFHPTLPGGTNTARSERIDYTFSTDRLGITARSIGVNEFADRVAGYRGFLSDHAGVETRFIWNAVPEPPSAPPERVAVAVTRLRALSRDSCNQLMDFFGDLQVTGGTAVTPRPASRVFEGNDVNPTTLRKTIRVNPDVTSVEATITISDDDDAFCGGGDDSVDVNPLADQEGVRISINLIERTVNLLNRDGSVNRTLGSVGAPLVLRGSRGAEVGEITFTVLFQSAPR